VVRLHFAADCCPCVEKLRTVLPLTEEVDREQSGKKGHGRGAEADWAGREDDGMTGKRRRRYCTVQVIERECKQTFASSAHPSSRCAHFLFLYYPARGGHQMHHTVSDTNS
jgi:hypothetical protein